MREVVKDGIYYRVFTFDTEEYYVSEATAIESCDLGEGETARQDVLLVERTCEDGSMFRSVVFQKWDFCKLEDEYDFMMMVNDQAWWESFDDVIATVEH